MGSTLVGSSAGLGLFAAGMPPGFTAYFGISASDTSDASDAVR